jgi:hypothetical protein
LHNCFARQALFRYRLPIMTRANPFPRFRFVTALFALALASLGATLSGCGISGDLTPAPPMMGDARAKYEAEQARKQEAAKAGAPAAPATPAPVQSTPPPAQ